MLCRESYQKKERKKKESKQERKTKEVQEGGMRESKCMFAQAEA